MKSALVICFTDLKSDARVTRQINFLKEDFELTAVCFDMHPDPKVKLYKLEKTKLTFLRKVALSVFLVSGLNQIAYYLLYDFKKHIRALREKKFDLIVANDIEALPLAFEIANGQSKVFFDAHEYAPRQFEDRLYWRLFFQRFNNALCKKYIPRVDGMSVVNEPIGAAYKAEFGVESIVITNAADYFDYTPKTTNEYPIRIVHHGIFTVSRQPDVMIEMMNRLDNRFTLDLIYLLPGSASETTRELFSRFKIKAEQTGKIRVLPALKSHEIVPYLHQHYDVGIILIPPVNFNYQNALPNKLFDCIQARLALAVGPLKEIANITTASEIGIVSDDFTAESMARAIQSLTLEDVNRYKLNTNNAARTMNAQFNKEIFLSALKKIV
jgi:glycosyltransferase involved in cell wall biosynthesis